MAKGQEVIGRRGGHTTFHIVITTHVPCCYVSDCLACLDSSTGLIFMQRADLLPRPRHRQLDVQAKMKMRSPGIANEKTNSCPEKTS